MTGRREGLSTARGRRTRRTARGPSRSTSREAAPHSASGTGRWNWDRSKVTSGDFTGDGKADVGILYNNGQQTDATNHTTLWTFTSTGTGFTNPARTWDLGSASWNADSAELTSGDFTGDGKADAAILYRYGRREDGTNRTGLRKLTSTGTAFAAPVLSWDSDGTGSWNWYRSDLV